MTKEEFTDEHEQWIDEQERKPIEDCYEAWHKKQNSGVDLNLFTVGEWNDIRRYQKYLDSMETLPVGNELYMTDEERKEILSVNRVADGKKLVCLPEDKINEYKRQF